MADQILCCKNIEIHGQIAFGPGCIIHPECSITANAGPLIFNEYNIIEERVRITNQSSREPIHIGAYNLFEVGTIIEDSEIGSMNVFSHRCSVPPGCKIGSRCIITAGVRLDPGTVIPDGVVVYGDGIMRPNPNAQDDVIRQNIRALCETLAKSLPKYNSMQSAHQK